MTNLPSPNGSRKGEMKSQIQNINRSIRILVAYVNSRYNGKGKCWQDWMDGHLVTILYYLGCFQKASSKQTSTSGQGILFTSSS